jgi:hypothetical protein
MCIRVYTYAHKYKCISNLAHMLSQASPLQSGRKCVRTNVSLQNTRVHGHICACMLTHQTKRGGKRQHICAYMLTHTRALIQLQLSTRLLELRCNRVRTHVINFQIHLDLSRTEFKYIPPDAGCLLEFSLFQCQNRLLPSSSDSCGSTYASISRVPLPVSLSHCLHLTIPFPARPLSSLSLRSWVNSDPSRPWTGPCQHHPLPLELTSRGRRGSRDGRVG